MFPSCTHRESSASLAASGVRMQAYIVFGPIIGLHSTVAARIPVAVDNAVTFTNKVTQYRTVYVETGTIVKFEQIVFQRLAQHVTDFAGVNL